MHWAVRTGLLSIEQVAFLPFRGTEEHVFTLQQVLRERARRRALTYLLFVDYRKAYDTVHLDALWAVPELGGCQCDDEYMRLCAWWGIKATSSELIIRML